MRKAQRIELFGEKVQAIKSELDKRDLSQLPTDKLFDLLIKYANVLNNGQRRRSSGERILTHWTISAMM